MYCSRWRKYLFLNTSTLNISYFVLLHSSCIIYMRRCAYAKNIEIVYFKTIILCSWYSIPFYLFFFFFVPRAIVDYIEFCILTYISFPCLLVQTKVTITTVETIFYFYNISWSKFINARVIWWEMKLCKIFCDAQNLFFLQIHFYSFYVKCYCQVAVCNFHEI